MVILHPAEPRGARGAGDPRTLSGDSAWREDGLRARHVLHVRHRETLDAASRKPLIRTARSHDGDDGMRGAAGGGLELAQTMGSSSASARVEEQPSRSRPRQDLDGDVARGWTTADLLLPA